MTSSSNDSRTPEDTERKDPKSVGESNPSSEASADKSDSLSLSGGPDAESHTPPADNMKTSRSAKIVGQTPWLVLLIFLVTLAVAFAVRRSGYLPLFSNSTSVSSSTKSAPQPDEFNRSYVLIAMHQGKLYFFDRQREGISEFSEDTGQQGEGISGGNRVQAEKRRQWIPRGKADLIPSVDRIVPSANGQKVALISNRDPYRSGIYVLDFSQAENPETFVTHWTKLLEPGYGLRGHTVAVWSPDGNTLAFVASKEKQSDLFVAISADKKPQRVTYHGKNIGTVFWRDDKHLAFVSDWDGKDHLYLINRNGGDLEKITP